METFGRYQLLRRLAQGGMAELFLARQDGPGGFQRQVVVKRILPALAANPDFVAMFLDEARIAARLHHPNVVQVLDLGVHQGAYFLCLEYVPGEDLRRVQLRAREQGLPLPQALVCRVAIEACAGLDHAHKQADAEGRPLGIIHRDVSPQNLLLSEDGAVKVADFGIAKAADAAAVTRPGVLKGKYAYMSPEQAQGQPIDHRTDVFALGVVVWELLTGTRLFRRDGDRETLAAVTACRVAPPSSVEPRVPPELDAVVMRALERDPTQRYQEARGFGEALEGWLLAHRLPSSAGHLAAYLRRLRPREPGPPPPPPMTLEPAPRAAAAPEPAPTAPRPGGSLALAAVAGAGLALALAAAAWLLVYGGLRP